MRNVTRLSALTLVCFTLLTSACERTETRPPASSTAGSPAATPAPASTSGVRLYISDETGGSVVVVDPESGNVVERIAVGKRPRGIRLSRDGKELLVALSGSPIAGPGVDESKLPPADRAADGIGVVDLATHTVVRKFQSGQDPEVFDISPDGKTIYVSNEDAAQVSVVDVATGNVVQRISVGEEPEGVTVSPDGGAVYVTSEASSDVAVIDTKTRKVLARIKTEVEVLNRDFPLP